MYWESPYLENGEWLRGNLHTHTNVSDGRYTAEEVVDFYKNTASNKVGRGMDYKWLVITDHNKRVHPERFVPLPNPEGFVVIEGYEESFGNHMLGIDCPMEFGEVVLDEEINTFSFHQKRVDYIKSKGGIAILPHPHWAQMDHWSKETAEKLEGYTGIEIINGDVFAGPGYFATDVWDAALTAGKRVWGFGADDFHNARDFHNAWTTVYARDCTKESIMEALRCGSSYTSNGAEFEKLYVEDDWIIVEAKDTNTTRLTEKTFKFIDADGKVREVQTGNGLTARYKAQGDEKYIRVELLLGWGAAAFSQPFFPKQQSQDELENH